MKDSFPSVEISNAELSFAHNFVKSTMKWNPAKRPTVQKMKVHPFFDSLKHSVIQTNISAKSDEIKPVGEKQVLDCSNNSTRKHMRQLKCNSLPPKSLSPKNVIDVKSQSDNIKPAVTNPFLEGWTEQKSKKMKHSNPFLSTSNSAEFLRNVMTKMDVMETYVRIPFPEGWMYVIDANSMNSVQESIEAEKHREFTENLCNQQTSNEFEMAEMCSTQPLASEEKKASKKGKKFNYITNKNK